MADRCENECPWIQVAKANAFLGSMPQPFDGFPSMTIPDENALRILLSSRTDAKGCEGPVEEVVLVKKGMPWNRRSVQERRVRCGLSELSPCAIPPELVEV
jgi:hypothetical protein